MPETIHPQVQEFLHFLKFQKRYSENTWVSYGTDLGQFFDYCQEQYELNDPVKVKTEFVRSWLATLKLGGMESRSLNRKISSLKSFYKFLLREGKIETTPLTAIISPKNRKRLPQFVESDDISLLFNQIEFPEGWEGNMQKLILNLLYHTGMRRAELIGLKEQQVNFANGSLKVLGKGNKERIIPTTSGLLNAIKSHIEEKHRLFGKDCQHVFVTGKGKPLYPKYVYLVSSTYLAKVTTIEKKSPHIFRHSFATHLMNNGAELNAVKELLGHSSLAATQVYTHNSIEKLKEVFKKAHPRA